MKIATTARFVSPALALLLAGAAHAQNDDFDAVQITAHHIAGNVHYLEGRGGNVGVVVADDGIIIVDDQFAPLTQKILAAIRGISDAPVRFVINTHVHPDHTGGNENLAAAGVTIMAHDNVRVRMTQGIRGGPPAPVAARPVLTYGNSIRLQAGDEEISVVKVPPAHTDGDSIIYFRSSNVLHLGDIFRTTGYPVIDFDNGGTAQGTLEALQIVLDMAGPDTAILPGHGVLSGVGDVREFRDMIAEVAGRVSDLIDQGMTLEQVLAAKPTADLDARWGSPDRFLPGLYNSLAAE